MLAFKKAIICLKKALKRPWRSFKDLRLKLEFKRAKLGLGSYIKPFVSLWGKLVGISYVFLLNVVGNEDPIGFSWFFCWYLSHVADIVARGFRCCSILCL